MVRKIILDTNFLLIPAQFNVDIFAEINRIMLESYKICTLDKVIQELKSITKDKKQSLKNKHAAKLALQLIKAKKVKILKTKNNNVDDILAKIKGYIIATQDIALKRRIKGKKIVLRQKKKLALV
ncbi:twitching motility protein PilT [Candidatus Woesearchaeota archaeon]|nr:twitching motility protein PilT [Candidatus Woesearchaeota archaeon]